MASISSRCFGTLGTIGLAIISAPSPALAWGVEGHQLIAEMALAQITDDAVKAKITDLLSGPALPSSPDEFKELGHDIGARATFADLYRDSDRNFEPPDKRVRYKQTNGWHYTNIDIDNPDYDRACPLQPPLTGPALFGPKNACIVDKINQFLAELANPDTPRDERVVALEFILHFVGDVHQPLHDADKQHDQGGNTRWLSVPTYKKKIKLHSFFDTTMILAIMKNNKTVASQLVANISPAQRVEWQQGTFKDWALEGHGLAKSTAYNLPTSPAGKFIPPKDNKEVPFFAVSSNYVKDAKALVSLQVKRASVRLAMLLTKALSP